MSEGILPYVYDFSRMHSIEKAQSCLEQGDVVRVTGELSDLFKRFYPEITACENDYVMILTQSCDLVRSSNRKPKADYITVCIIRKFSQYIDQDMLTKRLNPKILDSKKIVLEGVYNSLLDKLIKLINNSESKAHFFLPKNPPFEADMVALLSLPLPFRVDKYALFLDNKVLSLKAEFQAKIGNILAQMYGRVATSDLTDYGYSLSDIQQRVIDELDKLNLSSAPSDECIKYLQKNLKKTLWPDEQVKELMIEFTAIEKEKAFLSEKQKVTKRFKEQLFHLIRTPTLLNELKNCENDKELRTKINLYINNK
ncbi:MAG: hypothetical protein HKM04_01555 [Legionellales bacterium]|nr:hypothetical protein [Legionellales bacterium]